MALDPNYTHKQAASNLGISVGLLETWLCLHRKRQDANGSAEESDLRKRKRNAQLERDNKRLTMERDILKKAAAYFATDSL